MLLRFNDLLTIVFLIFRINSDDINFKWRLIIFVTLFIWLGVDNVDKGDIIILKLIFRGYCDYVNLYMRVFYYLLVLFIFIQLFLALMKQLFLFVDKFILSLHNFLVFLILDIF